MSKTRLEIQSWLSGQGPGPGLRSLGRPDQTSLQLQARFTRKENFFLSRIKKFRWNVEKRLFLERNWNYGTIGPGLELERFIFWNYVLGTQSVPDRAGLVPMCFVFGSLEDVAYSQE